MARATCEGCMSVDVRHWHRQGLLHAGQRFGHALTWGGEPTEGIGVLVKADAVVLVFRSRSWGGSYGQFIAQRVPITWTPCALAGDVRGFGAMCIPVADTVAAVSRCCTALVGYSPADTATACPTRADRSRCASEGY
jgi:hypothetical protein